MLILYGNRMSAPCNKVRYVCELLELPYEWHEMGFESGGLQTAEYLELHPAGKVPAMQDEDFCLFESEAICKYLCEKEESPLFPRELHSRAKIEQWINFANLHVGYAMNKVAFNRVIAPKLGMKVDESSLKQGLQWLNRYLPIVDAQISTYGYLGGPSLSLADITLLSIVGLAAPAKVSLSSYVGLEPWLKKLQDQPFYLQSHQHE